MVEVKERALGAPRPPPRPQLPARGPQGAPEQALRRFPRRGRKAAAPSP